MGGPSGPLLSFSPSGPFYGLVVGYLCQVHGFNEIGSRGIRAQMEQLEVDGVQLMLSQIDDERTRKAMEQIAAGGITGLLAEPALHSETSDRVEVDISRLAQAVVAEHRPTVPYLNRLSAGSLLILAWDTTEDQRTRARTGSSCVIVGTRPLTRADSRFGPRSRATLQVGEGVRSCGHLREHQSFTMAQTLGS